jgi:hypothetical protein
VARRTKAIEHSFAMANRVNNASAGSDGVDTSNVGAVEVDAETKSKYASYLLHYLLPCLIQINKDQMEELEAEARMQGKIGSLRNGSPANCGIQLIFVINPLIFFHNRSGTVRAECRAGCLLE